MIDLLETVEKAQPVEVLIPEARGRQRLRRRLVALTILVVLSLSAAVVVSMGLTSGTTRARPGEGGGIGPSASTARTARVKLALGEYLELQQSVLIPNYNDSAAWPIVTPSRPLGRSGAIHLVRDARGQFSLSKTQQGSMLRAAFAAARKVTTAQNMANMRTWLPGALATEAAPSNGFEVGSAGAFLTSFAIISQTATSVTVSARARTWESQAYQSRNGSVFVHTIQNGELETAVLVLVGRAWKVSFNNFTFLPGQGP